MKERKQATERREEGSSDGQSRKAELEKSPSRKKTSSFKRDKKRNSGAGDRVESSSISVPNFSDFRDLYEDEDERADSEDEAVTQGYPRRRGRTSQTLTRRSHTLSLRSVTSNLSVQAATNANQSSIQGRLQSTGNLHYGDPGDSEEEIAKPLPRLLAPRSSIAATVLQHHAPQRQVKGEKRLTEDNPHEASSESDDDRLQSIYAAETAPLQVKGDTGTRKKSHSAVGHMWKSIKKGIFNPKAAAADLHAISMSAAKQATEVMTTVAEKVETDMVALHDQILGGKRNLPDHAGRGRIAKPGKHFPVPVETGPATIRAYSEAEIPKLDSSIASAASQNQASLEQKACTDDTSVNEEPAIKPHKSLKSWARPSSSKGEPVVETSKGSAYMLSKYEEEEEIESQNKISEALTRTAEALTQSTEAVLSKATGSATYVKRLLACGRAGRN